jgi:hypothetical protein
MSLLDYGPRTDAEERDQAERYRAEAREDIAALCEAVGRDIARYTPSARLDAYKLECISDAICDGLADDYPYNTVLADGPSVDGYDVAARAIKRGAGINTERAA